jgi:hypothetical protein
MTQHHMANGNAGRFHNKPKHGEKIDNLAFTARIGRVMWSF